MKLRDIVSEIPQGNVKDMIKFFHKHKIKGRRASSYDCPIGLYIEKRGIKDVSVTRLAICSRKATISTSKVMYHFMNLFDAGKIPSLERKEK